MTNTNDFRRYSYDSDPAYALDAFNLTRSSVAPKRAPEKEKRKRGLRVAPNTKAKSKAQLKAEQKLGFRQSAAIFTVAVVVMSMFFAVVYTYAQKNELTRQISSLKTDIAIAESENISLNAELESMVSVSQIDAYAVEELGMVKLDASQINYIDSSAYKESRMAQIAQSAVQDDAAE